MRGNLNLNRTNCSRTITIRRRRPNPMKDNLINKTSSNLSRNRTSNDNSSTSRVLNFGSVYDYYHFRRSFSCCCRSDNHYNTLGLKRDATPKQIKVKFYELSKTYHPDINPNRGSEEGFKKFTEAYSILSDPKKRSEYDKRLYYYDDDDDALRSEPSSSSSSFSSNNVNNFVRRSRANYAWSIRNRNSGRTNFDNLRSSHDDDRISKKVQDSDKDFSTHLKRFERLARRRQKNSSGFMKENMKIDEEDDDDDQLKIHNLNRRRDRQGEDERSYGSRSDRNFDHHHNKVEPKPQSFKQAIRLGIIISIMFFVGGNIRVS